MHQGSTPQNRHCICEKSVHKSTEIRRENLKKNLPARVPGQRRLAISRLRVPNLDGCVSATAGNLLSIGAPRHGLDPEIARSHDTNRQKQRGTNLKKKNYRFECPVSVDWQSPDCESQILVSSPLLLAICFPSGLHATEETLRLSEVNKRIQRSREGKT